jgi:two-component system response regulator MprA
MTVLIVEDDGSVSRFLDQAIRESGYTCQVVADGLSALEVCATSGFDLILLDLKLPGLGGLEVCRQLRKSGLRTPILMITARDTLHDKVAGLDSGADDYIVKPFEMEELLARMRALLRGRGAVELPLRVGDLILDPLTHSATRGERSIPLSATEFSLLRELMSASHTVVTRAELLDRVWGYDFDGNDNVLDVYISYLRQKIDRGQQQPLIHTIRGVGFSLRAG